MSIEAKILLDSINPIGNRITTWVLTYPRFIHAEFMTHRVFSRNASSSRAIPVKKMLEDVKNNPAMPVYWGKNQSGMQAAEELDDIHAKEFYSESDEIGVMKFDGYLTPKEFCKTTWLKARDEAIKSVKKLNDAGLHKQIANRLLEPWMHITVLATATEHENFFALRAHKDAQPEFQALAYKMLDLYQNSKPQLRQPGEWHIPFGDTLDNTRIISSVGFKNMIHPAVDSGMLEETLLEAKLKIAAARCARVSYLNFDGKDDYDADIALADRLASSGHWSPFEHCAVPQYSGTIPYRSGNFVGWQQYRKQFSDENRRDSRLIGIGT